MQGPGVYFKNTPLTVGGFPSGLLHDESEGIAFVKQAQLPVPGLACGRININAAFDEIAVEIGNK